MKTLIPEFRIFLIILIISYSCTETIDIKLDSSYKRLTVFGEISTDTMVQSIKLTKSADYFYNLPAEGVTGAEVKISDGFTEILLNESTLNNGIYETSEDFYGEAGKTYFLVIQNVDIDSDGLYESYSASSTMPFLDTPDSIKVKYARYPFFQGTEISLFTRDPAKTNDFYAFKVRKNGILQSDSLPEINVQNDALFNGNYTNGVSVQYLDDNKPGEKVIPGDTIMFEMFGITKEYYTFINEAKTEFYGSNPLFSGPPANITSNLTNGAVGFFAAVNIKRITEIAPLK